MSDPLNVKSGEDPQSLAVRKEHALSTGDTATFFDILNGNTAPDPNELRTDSEEDKDEDGKKKKKAAVMTITEAYHEGISVFAQMGYTIELDPVGPFCKHSIYAETSAPKVDGIDYPACFRPLLPITDSQDEALQKMITRAKGHPDKNFQDLWVDTLDRRYSIDMERLAMSELMRKQQMESFTAAEPLKMRRAFDPLGDVTGRNKIPATDPSSWIPAKA